MQGKRIYTEKLFANFQLSERVPVDNFYRRLQEVLNLDFVYAATKSLYGTTGNPSLDPKVFFKLALVGYLENITSDRKLVEHCSMRLDLLYFLGYDIDEPFPWHSTVSRTRKLFPENLYEELFNKVFALCVNSGMVGGTMQCVDSSLSHANASKNSLIEVKQPVISIQEYLQKSKEENTEPTQKNEDTPSPLQKKTERKRRSLTDPEARMATRSGKGFQLSYLCNVAVDAEQQIVTHIQADYSDKRDGDCLPSILEKTQHRLEEQDLTIQHVLADANYSSGENYELLEQKDITAWIPVHGAFQPEREGFPYDEQNDLYVCTQGKQITLKETFVDKRRGRQYKYYSNSAKDCRDCPLKVVCIGERARFKKITRTANHHLYEQAYHRQQSAEGRRMKTLRSSKVESVIGTLMNFQGLRKLRLRGLKAVHKVMLLAATAYNLKKYMRQIADRTKIAAKSLPVTSLIANNLLGSFMKRLNVIPHPIQIIMVKRFCHS